MARKIKGAEPRAKIDFSPAVFQVVPVAYGDAAAMFTYGPEHGIWSTAYHMDPGFHEDTFVRLRPPPGVEVAWVEGVKAQCLKAGAAAVRIVPAAKAEVIPPLAGKRVPSPHQSIREVVTAMVAEANSQDRDALAALVESAISKEGL